MLEDLLLPRTLDLRLDRITIGDDALKLTVLATAHQVNCPQCAQTSASIHSHYTHRVADLPFAVVSLQLELQVRKFFCRNRECPRQIFTERLTPFINTYARQTTRLRDSLEQAGLHLGGEEGARLANKQSMPISHDSLFHWTRILTEAKVKTPRVLGVDDWAMHKGHTYGCAGYRRHPQRLE